MTAESRAPRVLLIHGFARQASHLFGWRERIPGLGFIHLPAHSGLPDLDTVSFDAWVDAVTDVMAILPQPPLVIAESLGAVLAMCVPTTALIAVEPLLTTDQLWPIHATIRNGRARGATISEAQEALFSRSFAPVLDLISVPTLVLAGDVPLLPPRDLATAPSVLTDDDFRAYAAHPLVEARRIAGGHVLLDENPGGVMSAAAAFMARHGYLQSGV